MRRRGDCTTCLVVLQTSTHSNLTQTRNQTLATLNKAWVSAIQSLLEIADFVRP